MFPGVTKKEKESQMRSRGLWGRWGSQKKRTKSMADEENKGKVLKEITVLSLRKEGIILGGNNYGICSVFGPYEVGGSAIYNPRLRVRSILGKRGLMVSEIG